MFHSSAPHEGAEDHVVVHDGRIDDALADGGRHLQLKDEQRRKIEEGGESHCMMRLQHAGRDDGGNRVRGIMKPVHEVECQGKNDQEDEDLEAHGGFAGLRGGSGVL